jgi:hypothetical protein
MQHWWGWRAAQVREGTTMTLDDGFTGRLKWEVVAAVSQHHGVLWRSR